MLDHAELEVNLEGSIDTASRKCGTTNKQDAIVASQAETIFQIGNSDRRLALLFEADFSKNLSN